MSDTQRPPSRSGMPPREREFRSQLAKLVHAEGLLRGNISVRERTCGKPGCKCAKGEKHVSLYVVFSEKGKYRQVFIPKDIEDEVRAWVDNHHKVRDLLEEVSRFHQEKIKKRKS